MLFRPLQIRKKTPVTADAFGDNIAAEFKKFTDVRAKDYAKFQIMIIIFNTKMSQLYSNGMHIVFGPYLRIGSSYVNEQKRKRNMCAVPKVTVRVLYSNGNTVRLRARSGSMSTVLNYCTSTKVLLYFSGARCAAQYFGCIKFHTDGLLTFSRARGNYAYVRVRWNSG